MKTFRFLEEKLDYWSKHITLNINQEKTLPTKRRSGLSINVFKNKDIKAKGSAIVENKFWRRQSRAQTVNKSHRKDLNTLESLHTIASDIPSKPSPVKFLSDLAQTGSSINLPTFKFDNFTLENPPKSIQSLRTKTLFKSSKFVKKSLKLKDSHAIPQRQSSHPQKSKSSPLPISKSSKSQVSLIQICEDFNRKFKEYKQTLENNDLFPTKDNERARILKIFMEEQSKQVIDDEDRKKMEGIGEEKKMDRKFKEIANEPVIIQLALQDNPIEESCKVIQFGFKPRVLNHDVDCYPKVREYAKDTHMPIRKFKEISSMYNSASAKMNRLK